MKLYTIGFTKKSAEEFFNLLRSNNVKHLIDVRLNNTSQLAGFSKGNDLGFFLKEICGIGYTHDTDLAPSGEIFDNFKKKIITWKQLEQLFTELLKERNTDNKLINKYKDKLDGACLLCSEADAKVCHRRLVAEFIKGNLPDKDIEIIHL